MLAGATPSAAGFFLKKAGSGPPGDNGTNGRSRKGKQLRGSCFFLQFFIDKSFTPIYYGRG
jgi:hypothetical protein